MLTRKQRLMSWWGLCVICFWFGGCYRLISYRLRADDLELMEREVLEELSMKKDVERFIKSGKLKDLTKDPKDFIKSNDQTDTK